MDDKTLSKNRPAYDQARSEYPHNLREHRVVLEPQAFETEPYSYLRDCADRDTGRARETAVNWFAIWYVDFKIYAQSEHCVAQWRHLNFWLNSATQHVPYRVLHWVNDGELSADTDWIVSRLSKLTWHGDLYLDIVSRHYGWDDPDRVRTRILKQVPRGLAGLDYRSVDQQSGMCEHHQLIHPFARRVIHYLY